MSSLWNSQPVLPDKSTLIWQELFENPKKVSFNITFTLWVAKSSLKMPKMVNFGEFFDKPEACGQRVLPDR